MEKSPSTRFFILSIIITAALLLFVVAVVAGLPARMTMQSASWSVFIAMLIIPGYLLTCILTRNLSMEFLERLALSLPVGMAAFSPPGLIVLILHLTLQDLLIGWMITTTLIFLGYFIFLYRRRATQSFVVQPWKVDEIILAVLLALAYLVALPVLTTYVINGDMYAFLVFASDILAGKPMNLTDPVFGTDIGPGLRTMFNQFIPILALWTSLSNLDAADLVGAAVRPMLALWGLLAAFFLGKAAGNGNRRTGLLVASIQMLVYLVEPFFQYGYVNESQFFLLGTAADKYTVTLTMLPVVFGLAIQYLRQGNRDVWICASVAAFAVSGIHPLVSGMCALGLAGFGGLHLLLNLRSRLAWAHVGALAVTAFITMFLSLVLLLLSLTTAPMAPSYPSTFEGWSIGEVMTPAFPFYRLPNLDWYGPLPDPARLEPQDVTSSTNPFLIWRYAVNMYRQKLLVFRLDRYISNPSVYLQPPYFLALVLLPLLFWKIRSNLSAQFAVGVTLALILIMFNPILLPLIGEAVMPWILYRFVWLLPYGVIIALVLTKLFDLIAKMVARALGNERVSLIVQASLPVALLVIAGYLLSPFIRANLTESLSGVLYPSLITEQRQLFERLNRETSKAEVMVAADMDLSVSIPGFVPNANIIAIRINNTTEFFPIDQQDIALERLLDQYYLFNTPYLTERSIEILQRYATSFVVVSTGSDLDLQFRLATNWFEWLMDDNQYSLYAVRKMPEVNDCIRGNTALVDHKLEAAQQFFQKALEQDSADPLALAGLASIYRMEGHFNQALEVWRQIASTHSSSQAFYRIGLVYQESGRLDESQAMFEQAVQAAPGVNIYHWALGDICIRKASPECAEKEYAKAVAYIPDEATRLLILGDHWQQQGRLDIAEELLRQSVHLRDSRQSQTALANLLQKAKKFDQAEKVLEAVRRDYPIDVRATLNLARLMVKQAKTDQAIDLFKQAIWLQDLEMRDSTEVHLALAQVMIKDNRLQAAEDEIKLALEYEPYNSLAYTLAGHLFRLKNEPAPAVAAFKKALQLDPSTIAALTSLRGQYLEQANLEENINLLEQETAVNPHDPRVFLYLGDQLQTFGETKSALSAYQLALYVLERSLETPWFGVRATGPTFKLEGIRSMKARIFGRIGLANEDLGETEKAMDSFRAAAAADPLNPAPKIALGDALRRHYELKEAEAVYQQVIEEIPDNLDAYANLVDIYQTQGKINQATTYLQKAVRAFQTQPDQTRQSLIRFGLDWVENDSLQLNALNGSDIPAGGSDDDLALLDGQFSLEDYYQALETEDDSDNILSLGAIYLRTSQIDQGIKLFETQIALSEEIPLPPITLSNYYNQLGNFYLEKSDLASAGQVYQRAIELNQFSAQPRLGVANVLLSQGDVEGARKVVESAAAITPTSIDTQLLLAEILSRQGDVQGSIQIYQKLAQSRPGNQRALLAMAQGYLRTNQLVEADNWFQKVLAINPGSAEAYNGLGRIRMAQGKPAAAEAYFRKSIQSNYTYLAAYLSLARALVNSADYQDAQEVYRQATAISPTNESIFIGLADIQHMLGKVGEAEATLVKAADLNPLSTGSLLSLAELYQEQGQLDQAEQALQQALRRNKTDLRVRSALARHYQSRGQEEQALEQLRLAVEEHPASMEAMGSYAEQLWQMGQEQQAQEWLQKAEEAGAPSAEGYRTLAAAYQELGDAKQALAMSDQAIALAPTDWVSLLQKAGLQEDMGEPEAALVTLEQATHLGPTEGEPWQALGALQLKLGKREAAKATLEQAIAVEPTYLPSYGVLVDAYQLPKELEQAQDTLAAARKVAPGSYLVDLYTARLEQDQGNWETAEKVLHQAIQKAPGKTEPYLLLGQQLTDEIRYEEASSLFDDAIALFPKETELYVRLANIQHVLGKVGEAEATLVKAADLNPLSTGSLLSLAELYQEQGQLDQAEQALQQALRRNKTDLRVRSALARHYQSRGQEEQALEQLRLAVEKHPASMEAMGSYAEQLWQMGQEQQAQEWLQKAEEAGAPSAEGYRTLAAAYQELGDTKQALAMSDQAIALAPTDWVSLLQKAGLQEDMGEPEAALVTLEQATHLGPTEGEPWQALGALQLKLGKREAAKATLEQAIAVEPAYLPSYGVLVDAYQLPKELEQAQDTLAAARKVAPGSYLVDLYTARLEQDQGNWETAEKVLHQAIQKAPGKTEPYFSLTISLFERRRFDEAEAVIGKALQIEPTDDRFLEQWTRIKIIIYNDLFLREAIDRASRKEALKKSSIASERVAYLLAMLSSLVQQSQNPLVWSQSWQTPQTRSWPGIRPACVDWNNATPEFYLVNPQQCVP